MNLPPVVIVPSRSDGAHAWQRVANLIATFTPEVVTVELLGDSLADDGRRVREAIEAASEPPLVLAHRYGAVAAAYAVTPSTCSQLVVVAGALLDYGETIAAICGGAASALTTAPIEAAGWRAVPTTYVICSADRRVTPAVQEHLAQHRATTYVSLDAGDQPHRTHAEALAQLVHEELVAVRGVQLPAAPALRSA